MPLSLQQTIGRRNYFDARYLFLTGQLSTEAPQANWVDHGQVLAPLMQTFPKINVERFHFGDNYLMAAER
jgi:hypothetical protein